MTLEFAQHEAQRRTEILETDHHVYQSLINNEDDGREYFITARLLSNGQTPIYSIFCRRL